MAARRRLARGVVFVAAAALVIMVAGVVPVAADEDSHSYEDGEAVTLWLNKVGPYHNPQETYTYYHLPFCRPELELTPAEKFSGFGIIFDGAEFLNSNVPIKFKETVTQAPICTIPSLAAKDCAKFSYASSNHYWYQMYMDDLPIWGMVGESSLSAGLRMIDHEEEHGIADEVFIFSHKQFSIAYNGPRIIEVNLTSENPVQLDEGVEIKFTYGVNWVPTSKDFADRFSRYLDHSFFEHQIHWFSIFNSFMMVVFLCGLVALILMRTLRNDYAKYMHEEDDLEDKGIGEESGWKLVHGDVFRKPDHLAFYCALIGTGYQLVLLIGSVILVALLGSLYVERGKIVTVSLVSYALTSFVAGYKSGAMYRGYHYPKKAPGWKGAMMLTAFLFPGMCFGTVFMLNLISLYYSTSNVIPFSVMLMLLAYWGLVSLPLVVGGTILGRVWGGQSKPPCRVNNLPRPIPPRRWFSHPAVIAAVSGILPFGSIFIEMYFVFTSFWNYKFYYVYGFMLLVYVILIIVSSCVTVVAVYFLLNAEDYRWPWTSFFCAGSTAGYVYLYSIYYFFRKTSMSGFLQTAFYFGYMGMFCLGLLTLCGTIGVAAASKFVHRIYRNIKVD